MIFTLILAIIPSCRPCRSIFAWNTCQASQGGHGACLKNMRLKFDSSAWHILCAIENHFPKIEPTISLMKLIIKLKKLLNKPKNILMPPSAMPLLALLKSV